MRNNKKIKNQILKIKNERGAAAILMSVFVLSIILLIAFTTAGIMLAEVKMSSEIGNSIPAFYAADAGAEQCLYWARRGAAGDPCFCDDDNPCPPTGSVSGTLTNVTFVATRVSETEIDSVGKYIQLDINRSVEVTWEP